MAYSVSDPVFCLDPDPVLKFWWIRILDTGVKKLLILKIVIKIDGNISLQSGLDPAEKKIMDPVPVCPHRLDPVNKRPDPKPWWQRGSIIEMTKNRFFFVI